MTIEQQIERLTGIVDALAGAVRIAGAGVTSIAWQFSTWRCSNPACDTTFPLEPSKPCPRCGTLAAATYGNPEGLG